MKRNDCGEVVTSSMRIHFWVKKAFFKPGGEIVTSFKLYEEEVPKTGVKLSHFAQKRTGVKLSHSGVLLSHFRGEIVTL